MRVGELHADREQCFEDAVEYLGTRLDAVAVNGEIPWN
jgi:hypothetical protein